MATIKAPRNEKDVVEATATSRADSASPSSQASNDSAKLSWSPSPSQHKHGFLPLDSSQPISSPAAKPMFNLRPPEYSDLEENSPDVPLKCSRDLSTGTDHELERLRGSRASTRSCSSSLNSSGKQSSPIQRTLDPDKVTQAPQAATTSSVLDVGAAQTSSKAVLDYETTAVPSLDCSTTDQQQASDPMRQLPSCICVDQLTRSSVAQSTGTIQVERTSRTGTPQTNAMNNGQDLTSVERPRSPGSTYPEDRRSTKHSAPAPLVLETQSSLSIDSDRNLMALATDEISTRAPRSSSQDAEIRWRSPTKSSHR